MDQLDAHLKGQLFHAQVGQRANAGGTITQLTWLTLGRRAERGQRLEFRVTTDHHEGGVA